ncbi:synaptotagmin-like protein 1 isoform X2 [Electrophorus electricus]|uniref:synaptotagmin-like protein 1 isoform X2 n=1 Tax=Electrophorus electricus TaxID=8005 RepID=UPI0015D026AA|nr:synaptotagmin-like protein 1 isoform X2 [Electrophorus electricus]
MEKEALLDLGHLTEVEQTMILNVLLRDAELQQQEEGRISKLQQVESDPVRLRSLTGAWFNEERAKRHHSRGADIIHASIRHKRRSKDLPVSSAFEEKKEENSERQEESTVENTEDLEDTGIAEHGIETGEEKSESPNLSVVPQPRPRTRLAAQNTENRESVSGVRGNADDSDIAEDMDMLRNTPPPLQVYATDIHTQVDSEGDIDSGSTELYYSKFGSINSLHSNHMFSLQYDTKREELCVRVCRCQNLAPARNSHSDPYVKVYLLPDNTSRSKRKTSVKRKTLNPIYDETLKYKVRQSDLQARVLSVSVWHMERVRRNLFLGEVEVGLAQWDWGRSQPIWYPLMPRVQMNPDAILSRGTILLSLKFIPPGSEEGGYPLTGELHIWLKEIVGLIPPKRGSPSTYVKSVVLPDESGISGQQTRVVRGSVSPLFNHTMVYDGLQLSDLTQACTEITVWNSSACLGGVRLSMGSGVSYGQMVCWMDSTEEEISVWNTVIKNSNAWVDTALPIRTNLRLCSE